MSAWMTSMTGNIVAYVGNGHTAPFAVFFKAVIGFAAIAIVLFGAFGIESFGWQIVVGGLGALIGVAFAWRAGSHASSGR
jgi:drug/metabolite transporter (DMT)-like permease